MSSAFPKKRAKRAVRGFPGRPTGLPQNLPQHIPFAKFFSQVCLKEVF